ncbi:hypothetical protein ACSBR2_015130 [Camellia fascicularis]
MGRDSSDQIVIQSSIALLQERFRQLERVKEMREGRELLRSLLESKTYSIPTPNAQYEPSKLFFKSEILIPQPRTPCQVSLSLWPNSQIKHSNFTSETPPQLLMKSWPTDNKPVLRSPPIKFNDSAYDVDTSLHL